MDTVARGLKVSQRRVPIPRDDERPVVLFLRQPLYSRAAFVVAGTQTVPFFTVGGGGGVPLISDLALPNQIPFPSSFDVFGFSIVLQQGMPEVDIVNYFNFAYFEFAISKKPFLQLPAAKIPAGCGLTGLAAVSNPLILVPIFQSQNGVPSPMATWPMDINGLSIYLPAQQDFTCTIQTFSVVPFSAAFFATVYMEGILSTPVM